MSLTDLLIQSVHCAGDLKQKSLSYAYENHLCPPATSSQFVILYVIYTQMVMSLPIPYLTTFITICVSVSLHCGCYLAHAECAFFHNILVNHAPLFNMSVTTIFGCLFILQYANALLDAFLFHIKNVWYTAHMLQP